MMALVDWKSILPVGSPGGLSMDKRDELLASPWVGRTPASYSRMLALAFSFRSRDMTRTAGTAAFLGGEMMPVVNGSMPP
jgi:hypothetical protein